MSHQILKLREVSSLTKLSNSTIYRLIKTGDFPKPIKLATHASGWLLVDIEDWIESKRRVHICGGQS
jgi:prophage regulatory protein